MTKVQPPELRKFMDKKISSECWGMAPHGGARARARAEPAASALWLEPACHAGQSAPAAGSSPRARHCYNPDAAQPPAPASHTRTQQKNKTRNQNKVALNANRHVTGTLRGFDQFMNLVLDGTVDVKAKVDIGMVVRGVVVCFCFVCICVCVERGGGVACCVLWCVGAVVCSVG